MGCVCHSERLRRCSQSLRGRPSSSTVLLCQQTPYLFNGLHCLGLTWATKQTSGLHPRWNVAARPARTKERVAPHGRLCSGSGRAHRAQSLPGARVQDGSGPREVRSLKMMKAGAWQAQGCTPPFTASVHPHTPTRGDCPSAGVHTRRAELGEGGFGQQPPGPPGRTGRASWSFAMSELGTDTSIHIQTSCWHWPGSQHSAPSAASTRPALVLSAKRTWKASRS